MQETPSKLKSNASKATPASNLTPTPDTKKSPISKLFLDNLAMISQKCQRQLARIVRTNFRITPYIQQRVVIARAIVNNPGILLADEPTGALDVKTSEEIIGVFRELNEQGITVIIITHDMEVADACERVIEISDGKIGE